MKKKAIIAGIAALTITASISGLIVSAENEATVPEDNSAYEVQLPEVTESSEDTALSFDVNSWYDFEYELDSKSTYATITKYNGTSGDVVIPDIVNGVPVKKLADGLFKGKTKITSVRIDCTQLAVIPYQCFSGCTNLQSVNIPEGVKTITGQAFENCSSLTSITFPSTLQEIQTYQRAAYTEYYGAFEGCTSLSEVIFKPGTTEASIGPEAFLGTAITSLNLPANYTSIGESAFANCTKLTTITSTGGLKTIPYRAFVNCTSLESVTLNEGIEVIGGQAFESCSSLTSITFPSTLQEIQTYQRAAYTEYYGAFEGCTSLSEIIFKPGTTEASIGQEAFLGTAITSLRIPSNYTTISQGAFAECKNLKTVTSVGGVKDLPNALFNNCTSLETVILHEGLETIGQLAFGGCTKLTSVNIPEGVTTIYGQAFQNCSSLTSITLPSTMQEIQTYQRAAHTEYYGAFEGCTSLSEVIFKPGTTEASIGPEAFLGTAITSLNLPANYTSIGESAFANCTKLTTITSTGGLKTIPYRAFINCTSLKSVTLNEGIEVIGGQAFESCSSLTSITFPSTLQEIQTYQRAAHTEYYGAFEGCTSLSEVVFTPGTKIASIGPEAFAGSGVVTLTIPYNYTSIGESAFANCKKLTLVYFVNGTNNVTLGSDIFNGCTALRHAVLSKSVKSIGDNAFSNCKLATVVSCDETAFQTNTFTGVKANVKYNTFNGRAKVTAIQTEAEKVHIPCIISGYPTSSQMPSSFVGTAVVDHLYFGNNCYICGVSIKPKPTATPGSESITLSWDTINSASKYAVYNYYNGNFELVAEVEDSSYTMANLNAGETYGFALSAYNNGKWTTLFPEDVVYATPEGSAVNAFVDRLYTIILGRGAEPAGLADWTNRLTSGTATSAEIVYGIAGSQEFQEKNYANDVIVEKMYNAMLGRGSDPAGKENWVKQLDAGMSFNAIINGFSGSQEFTEVCAGYGILPGNISQIEPRDINAGLTAFVSRMYTKALGRGYDVNGLNDWTGSYLNGTATTADIAYGFIFSKEFTEKNYTDEQYVDILYSTFFDRAPDEGGKQNWLNDLANGKSREYVLNGFLGSQEFLNLAASFGV